MRSNLSTDANSSSNLVTHGQRLDLFEEVLISSAGVSLAITGNFGRKTSGDKIVKT